jgi:CRISPR-associated protein Cas1
MTTVYIDHREADIDLDGDRLVVRAAGERKGTVPLRLIERVVVAGSARLTTRLVIRLKALGIGLLVLGRRVDRPVGVAPAAADVALRFAQYELSREPGARLALARPLVARKIDGHAALLNALVARQRGDRHRIIHARGVLVEAAERVRTGMLPGLGALMGHEGSAAAAYFPAFATAFAPALGFAGRNRRPPRDPVNVCLSIGYTMLHAEALRASLREGLDPEVGVYHDVKPGRESLICDLVEPVRANIDGFVHDLFADNVLRRENFTSHGPEGCSLGKAGRAAFYRAFEEKIATAVRQAVAAEAAAIAVAIRGHVTNRPAAPTPSPVASPLPFPGGNGSA